MKQTKPNILTINLKGKRRNKIEKTKEHSEESMGGYFQLVPELWYS